MSALLSIDPTAVHTLELPKLEAGLTSAMLQLHSDDIIKSIETQLNNPNNITQITMQALRTSNDLGSDTIRAYRSFDDARNTLDQLQDRREPWVSKWQTLRQVCLYEI